MNDDTIAESMNIPGGVEPPSICQKVGAPYPLVWHGSVFQLLGIGTDEE